MTRPSPVTFSGEPAVADDRPRTAGDRADGRTNDALRPLSFEVGAQDYAEGSVIVSAGRTRVLCAASLETGVPPWRRGTGEGWVTAEYAMLPRATASRTSRESRGKIKGRTQEIQRLIGRSLRAAIDLDGLGENTITVDCDVLQADGGTRTASVTGGWVALALALRTGVEREVLSEQPSLAPLAAVSVGVVDGSAMLDLAYTEDVAAEVDMNVVALGDGRFVEVQGTAEGEPFPRGQLDRLLDLAGAGCEAIFPQQAAALEPR